MDIQYLLWLQELRGATGGLFDEFFNALSKFAVNFLPFLPFIIFWGVDKKWGYIFMTNHFFGELLNGVIKLTVCAYRPWIRSDLIEPAGDSKTAATGYSFPSGHTRTATTVYGTIFVWQKDKRKWLAVLCAVLIVLTGFSRNFLGVHTPQDVVVAFLESILVIFVVGIVSKKIDGNEKVYDILTAIGVIVVIASLAYIQLKSYPMDYDAAGKLLVDPQKMMNDCFKAAGAFLGFLIGSYVDRHYIHYEIPFGSRYLPLLVCVGAGLCLAWKELFAPATIVAAFGGHWGNFIARLIMVLFAMIIWPLVIRKECAE
ncbi:PAP2 family protein [Butyrivibrio proteoclasticus B316]|uniref:PAP2 family protein n=1 Tax=Butyrivibrio proteoclasticus (strain ATCC 51982 / DSM 14932 / B316) TaxID=515622 RepID=E0RUW6_BUTPB|nr:phosphatase PAP2 family protein [Butyrivibrio proteoclasticus]ADL34157.1 PAP2 family protein [Butyrivibrio proteoclasticus B316]